MKKNSDNASMNQWMHCKNTNLVVFSIIHSPTAIHSYQMEHQNTISSAKLVYPQIYRSLKSDILDLNEISNQNLLLEFNYQIAKMGSI